MLMNNLDLEVAEYPDNLVVYGGTGRATDALTGAFTPAETDRIVRAEMGLTVADAVWAATAGGATVYRDGMPLT